MIPVLKSLLFISLVYITPQRGFCQDSIAIIRSINGKWKLVQHNYERNGKKETLTYKSTDIRWLLFEPDHTYSLTTKFEGYNTNITKGNGHWEVMQNPSFFLIVNRFLMTNRSLLGTIASL